MSHQRDGRDRANEQTGWAGRVEGWDDKSDVKRTKRNNQLRRHFEMLLLLNFIKTIGLLISDGREPGASSISLLFVLFTCSRRCTERGSSF